MTVPDTDRTLVIGGLAVVQLNNAEHLLSFSCKTILLFRDLSLVRFDHFGNRVDHINV